MSVSMKFLRLWFIYWFLSGFFFLFVFTMILQIVFVVFTFTPVSAPNWSGSYMWQEVVQWYGLWNIVRLPLFCLPLFYFNLASCCSSDFIGAPGEWRWVEPWPVNAG